MLEMHGRIFDVACTACGHTELDYSSPVCEALRGTEDLMDAGATDPTIAIENLPRCKKCEKLARPGVVWFEEMPQHLDTISDLLEADLCIVVGTSSTVSAEQLSIS
jgi:NAD-dependent deacetylase sirtuin 5